MTGLKTTVKIVRDPQGLQAQSPYAHLMGTADPAVEAELRRQEQSEGNGMYSPGNVPPPQSSEPGPPQPDISPAPVQTRLIAANASDQTAPQSAAQASLPAGARVVQHGTVPPSLEAMGGVEVPSGVPGTKVVIHRRQIVQEVAPGVRINVGYEDAPLVSEEHEQKARHPENEKKVLKKARTKTQKKTVAKKKKTATRKNTTRKKAAAKKTRKTTTKKTRAKKKT